MFKWANTIYYTLHSPAIECKVNPKSDKFLMKLFYSGWFSLIVRMGETLITQ